jgi:hypothetical protein
MKKEAAPRRCGAAPAYRGDKNKIRGIYNRAAYWSERVRLMQHWANRLDRLRKGVTVPLRKSA